MDYINDQDDVEPDVKSFLEGCYIENRRVVRRAEQTAVTVPEGLRYLDMSEEERQRAIQQTKQQAIRAAEDLFS